MQVGRRDDGGPRGDGGFGIHVVDDDFAADSETIVVFQVGLQGVNLDEAADVVG